MRNILLNAGAAFLAFFVQICFADGGTNTQCYGNWTIVNGQIYTPGLAIVDSPQPCTPEGGDYLQVAIDVSGDGKLPWPPVFANGTNVASGFYSITLFLYSYEENKNFTISNNTNATNAEWAPPYLNILDQESGSTVKHVNWLWPDCLVGVGANNGSASNARGSYNISMHQAFRLNGSDYYTIFDLPITVGNSINAAPQAGDNNNSPDANIGPFGPNGSRIACAALENPLLSYDAQLASTHAPSTQPYLGGPVSVSGASQPGSSGSGGNGSGSGKIGGAVSSKTPSVSILGLLVAVIAAMGWL